MSDPQDAHGEDRETEALRALLKRALGAEAMGPAPDLLPGVQRRIRRRSRGKFFADRWSTTQARAAWLVVGTGALTLIVVLLAYYALGAIGLR